VDSDRVNFRPAMKLAKQSLRAFAGRNRSLATAEQIAFGTDHKMRTGCEETFWLQAIASPKQRMPRSTFD
jgi:hypothetical protein